MKFLIGADLAPTTLFRSSVFNRVFYQRLNGKYGDVKAPCLQVVLYFKFVTKTYFFQIEIGVNVPYFRVKINHLTFV